MSSATKSKISAMVSGAGMAADVWTRLDGAVKKQGGIDEDLHLLARDEGQPMIDMIAALLVKAGAATRNVYPITVNYAQAFEEMVGAGKYDYRNDCITAVNFPITGEGMVNYEAVLFHPNRDLESEDAVKEMTQIGLEPAKTEHLLAFGAKFPEIQREFPVVALGSSWVRPHRSRNVPYLDRWFGERDLRLIRWAGEWFAYCRFLALRKKKS